MMRWWTCLALVLPCLWTLSALRGHADAGQVFVTVLTDMPVMEGLQEDKTQSLLFDKEEGRVAESVLSGKNIPVQEVKSYYEDVLGQLGWKPQKTGVFIRNDEQLIVNIEKVGEGVRVVLSLSPKMP